MRARAAAAMMVLCASKYLVVRARCMRVCRRSAIPAAAATAAAAANVNEPVRMRFHERVCTRVANTHTHTVERQISDEPVRLAYAAHAYALGMRESGVVCVCVQCLHAKHAV